MIDLINEINDYNGNKVIVYEEDRKEYYKALETFDKDEELEPLVLFITNQCIKTWCRRK